MCYKQKEIWELYMAKLIIVVDDDKEIREIVSVALKYNGFEVAAVSNSQQLQRLLAVRIPDLIILDIMMPGQNGYQIFNALRNDAQTRGIPVMIMTARVEYIYERISMDLGVADHITKPFHPLDLVE